MFETDWFKQGDEVNLDRVEKPLKEITMLVIMGAAFGYVDDWIPQQALPPGHTLTFRESLQSVLHNWYILSLVPKFFWGTEQNRRAMRPGGLAGSGWMGKRVQQTAVAYAELGRYMCDMVHEHQTGSTEAKRENRDVFSVMTAAIQSEKENTRMSMDEVLGNMFIFLLAGHETTAHTLAYVFGLLALEEREQERLYEHIMTVVGQRELEYSDFTKLDRVMGVMYEAMRLFPPIIGIPKYSAEDAHFTVEAAHSEEQLADPTLSEESRTRKKQVFIPKGAEIGLNSAALHYNPKYWPNPYRFDPERFMKKDWPKGAFLGFSLGPRECLGKRFAEVESIVTIALIIRQYKVSVDTTKFLEIAGESRLARRYDCCRGSRSSP
ncbi:hypothetical protein FRB94_002373 [Tulasnella sp. JGI-2019a]|nr:hypothetical protein FRB94_002373 [Tulasnella sp. JGI-2019a]